MVLLLADELDESDKDAVVVRLKSKLNTAVARGVNAQRGEEGKSETSAEALCLC